MSLWDFLHAHPVWGFVYLTTVVLGVLAATATWAETKTTKQKIESLMGVFKAQLGELSAHREMDDHENP